MADLDTSRRGKSSVVMHLWAQSVPVLSWRMHATPLAGPAHTPSLYVHLGCRMQTEIHSLFSHSLGMSLASYSDTPISLAPDERTLSPTVRSTPPVSTPAVPPAASVPAGLPASLAALLGAPSASNTQSSAPQSTEHLLSSLSSLISQGVR